MDFKKIIRRSKTLVEFIIALIGLVLILVDTLALHIGALSGIGTSLLASAIMVFLTDLLLGTDDDEVKKWGLEKVYKTRGEMNHSCDRYLQKAKFVNAIAFGMRSWRTSQNKAIERILKQGGNIRIITMNPDSEFIAAREKDENATKGEISNSIRQMIVWADTINAKDYPGKIMIRCHWHLPLDFLFLLDNRLYTGPYEYGKISQQTISFEYNSSGTAYDYYREYFEDLWNNQEFCKEYHE